MKLLDLFFGEPPYERSDAPEPSLLPHLAKMVHAVERHVVQSAGERTGLDGGEAPPWPPLWHAVAAALGLPDASASRSGFSFADRATDLPALPPDERRREADDLVDELRSLPAIPWYLALAVSRIAPFATPGRTWPVTGDPVWDDHIAGLAAADWPATAHGDVLRAHPFASLLESIDGLHETSGMAADAIRNRWGAQPTAAAAPPPDSDSGSDSVGGDAALDAPAATTPMASDALPTAADAPPATLPPAHAPTTPRALQADVTIGTRTLRHAFVAGETHGVAISIGRQASTRSTVAFPDVAMPDDADFVVLTVQFSPSDQTEVQTKTIKHFKDEARESTVADFSFDIPAGVDQATALVSVHQGAEVLQAAILTGAVVTTVDDEGDAPGRLALQVNAHVKSFVAPVGSTDASVVTDGNSAVATGSSGRPATVRIVNLSSIVASLAERIDDAAGLLLDGADDELEHLFRDLARHGKRLGAALVEQLGATLSEATHLQIVTVTRGAILPLEFVYDGPAPTARSKLCEQWRAAAATGSCSSCREREPGRNPVVCPSYFWALRKVIARHAGLGDGAGDFTVRSEPSDALDTLPPIERAVVGASAKVTSKSVRTIAKASKNSFGRARTASNWSKWRGLISSTEPNLLVALPHLESDLSAGAPIPSLEIGNALLASGAVTDKYIGKGRPGPVVLLLGCNTSFLPDEIDDFSGQFRAAGSSAVVATLGRLIPEDAARAATTIVEAVAAGMTTATSLGELMLDVRRRLVSSGVVLGFLLVANGDADWKLSGVAA